MEQTQEQTFEAWVDEKRRLGSFHKIPGARRYCAPERAFWEQVTELVLSGYRVQEGASDTKQRMLRLSRQDGCPGGGHRFIMDIYNISGRIMQKRWANYM